MAKGDNKDKDKSNRVQIINMRGMNLDEITTNLRPVVACEISSTIPVQVINIEGLKIDELAKSLRLVVACEISSEPMK